MKQLIIFALIILSYQEIKAQKHDRIRITIGATVGLVVMPLSGTIDKGNGNMSITSNTIVTSYPEFRHVDTTAIAFNMFIPLGINLPLYQTKKWSTGIKLSAGFGYQAGVKAAEGLSSIGFDFPQFAYYRRFAGKIDYSILAGWKYSYVPVPYQLALLGLDINTDGTILRFYFSPFPYKYYRQLTNGTVEPAISVYEVGVGGIFMFGK
jgi:hypothetical protein